MAYARPWFRDAKNTRSKVPLFPATFAPWAPRALAADAADDVELVGDDSGERFVLFETASGGRHAFREILTGKTMKNRHGRAW